jgi:Fe-S cluster assembly scaffold protein SufB
MKETDEIKNMRDTLRQQRDAIRLQIHLAKLEAMEEWEIAEQKFDDFEGKINEFAINATNVSKDVFASAKHLGEEIRHAYDRIRRHL